MSSRSNNTTNIRQITPHVSRLRANWSAEMRQAFAQGQEPRGATRDRPITSPNKLLALFLGVPAAVLLAAIALRTFTGS